MNCIYNVQIISYLSNTSYTVINKEKYILCKV